MNASKYIKKVAVCICRRIEFYLYVCFRVLHVYEWVRVIRALYSIVYHVINI